VQELRKRGWTGRALPQLIEHAAREEDDSVQLSIALALRDLEDSRAVGTLWALFESGSDAVQMAALQGLSLLGDERVIPIAVSWYQSRDAGLEAKAKRSIGIFDLLLLQSTNGDRAVADLLAAETSWRQRLLIRRTARRARRWLASHT
jgi:HEAT repeat protein